MTIKDILDLGKMGYTKEDIEALIARENAAQGAKSEDKPKPAEPAQVPQNQEPPKADPLTASKKEPPKADGTELDRLFAKLSELTTALQAHNRGAAEMGASIIDPRIVGVNALSALSGFGTNKKEE